MTPARNRVSPRGNIIAAPGRGGWMGNRGRLHEGYGTHDIVRNHRSKAWITCRLEFRDRYTRQWDPTHYTQLFFLDEAVALAASHRPCAECRRGDYNAYRSAWQQSRGGAVPFAKNMDTILHRERLHAGRRLAPWTDLPDGVFVETDGKSRGRSMAGRPSSHHRRTLRCRAPGIRSRSIALSQAVRTASSAE